jgi:hypothetical protein
MNQFFKRMLFAVLFCVPWVAGAQTHYNLQVGYGTESSQYVPDYTYYNYSYTQMLLTANEVGIDGLIDSLAFQVQSGGATRSLTVYMAEVGQTTLSNQLSADQFHQVFSGSVTWTSGWINIALDTTFEYHDTGSLVIAVIDGTGSYQSGYPYYFGSTMSDTRSRYVYNDGSAYTLSSQLSNSSNFLPNIRLGITSNSSYCANPSDLTVSNIDFDSAHFSWVENGSATSWEIVLSETALTDFQDVTGTIVNDNSYTVTGLGSNVLYYVYVRAICDASSVSGWTNATMFRSACVGYTAIPYVTGFEDAFGGMPNCWDRLAVGTSGSGTFPAAYEHAPNARNGNNYFEFESNSGQTEIAVLPLMDNINTLQLEFYASCMNTNFTLEVGVIEEDSVFVPVDTVTLTPGVGGNWHSFYYPYVVYFDQYTGSGSNMAMRVKGVGSYTLMIDDLSVTPIPSCLPPTGFAVNNIGNDWVGLIWTDDNGSSWEVIYDTLPIDPATTSLSAMAVSDNNVILNGLVNGKEYNAYLRGDCGGDYSPWVGPLTFIPGVYNMRFSGTDTISACGLTIYDDGGANGDYTTYASSVLVLYPSSEDSLIAFSGNTSIYSYYAQLRIFDGVGTSGLLLWQSNSDVETIPPTTSFSGPITIQFNAGSYSYYNSGFEINTTCIGVPQCASVQNLQVPTVSTSSAYASWDVAGLNLGTPTGYEVYCYDTTGNLVFTEIATTTNIMISGLTPVNSYLLKVRSTCGGEDNGDFDSVLFNTLSLACAETNPANTHYDTVGNGTSNGNYLPVYTCYNYSLSQQIYKASELNGGGSLSTLSFMPSSIATPNGTSRNIEIYIAHISDSTASNFVYPADLTLVYSGTPSFVANQWCEIEFDNPFNYNGVDNLFVMFRDLTGVYSCSNAWYSHTATSGASHYVYQDSGPYAIGYTGGYSSSERMNAVFGFIECTQLADCAAPIVVVDSVATDFISISWGAGFQETSWTVDYRVDSVSTWTAVGTTSNTHLDFSNMGVNTRYHFRVGAVCGDTILYTTISVLTKCGAESLPFIYGFEDFPSTGYPSCWYKATTYSYGEYPLASTGTVHGGNTSLYMYSGSGSYSYVVLPEMDAPIDTLEIGFWMIAPYSGSNNELYVGVMSDPENFNTFQNVGIVTVSQVAAWEPVKVRFNNYMGNGTRIAIVSPSSDYVNIYIDDINVNVVSPCSGVENISLDNVTTDNATIVWDSLDVNAYEYVYGISGFDIDTATVVNATSNNAVLTNLTANTQYDIYVRAICGDGDTSNWSNAFTFRTDCIKLTTIPYTESFENNAPGWSNYNNTNFYPCWYRSNNPNSSYYYPYVYNYNAHSGNYGLYWNWDSYDNFNPYITLPAIDTNVIDISTMMLSFWAMNGYSNYAPTVLIGTMTDPQSIATFQVLDTIVFLNTDYTKYEVPLNNYNGHGEYIAILTTYPVNGNSYWYGYMDDITLDTIPSCMHVFDLAVTANTSSSVSIAWNEAGSATTWDIAVDTDPTATPVADTTVSGTSVVTVNGLTTGTPYYFWVRSVCSATDASAWEGPVMSIPGSWFMIPNQTDTLVMCGGVITDDGGPDGAYSNSQESYVIIRPETPGSLVSVSGTSYTESTYDHLHIYDGEGTSGVEFWNDYGVSTNQTFGPFVSNSGSITLYFKSDGSVTYDGFVVNVSCYTDNCPVSDLMLDEEVSPSSSSLALTWTGSSTSYDVAYGIVGIDVDSATYLSTTTNSIVIGGLDPITTYDIYVRGLCNEGDTGMWHKITLRTPLCDGAFVVENWDSTMSATTSLYAPIGFSTYNYSYVQTIVDSAFFAGLENEIIAFEFQPSSTSAGSYFTHMTVYMANVSESNLSNGFIHPDSAHVFVPVIVDRDMSYNSTDWQMHGFDSSFIWDGHSNVLVAINREHGTWASGGSFNAHNSASDKTLYLYQDSGPYDPYTVSGGNSLSVTGDFRFYSCGISCAKPMLLPVSDITYSGATVNWNSAATDFEVAVKAATDAAWSTEVSVSNATSYAFSGLLPETMYQYRVRAICDAAEGLVSDWVEGSFTTDELPCFDPSDLHTTEIGYTTATLAWDADASQNMWSIMVWNTGAAPVEFTANGSSTFTVTGLAASTGYYAAVKALCGGGIVESNYSDTIQFTTATCAQVTGVNVTNITATGATVSWTPTGASKYIIEYGDLNFTQGTGTTVVVENATSYTINGLDDDEDYSVFVMAVCEEGVEGAWSDKVDFSTPAGTAVNIVDGASTISIYPNPASDVTTIALNGVSGEVTITIVDMNGRTVQSETMTCEGDCTKRMEVSGLAQGAYFVRVSGEGMNQVKKLVVK